MVGVLEEALRIRTKICFRIFVNFNEGAKRERSAHEVK